MNNEPSGPSYTTVHIYLFTLARSFVGRFASIQHRSDFSKLSFNEECDRNVMQIDSRNSISGVKNHPHKQIIQFHDNPYEFPDIIIITNLNAVRTVDTLV